MTKLEQLLLARIQILESIISMMMQDVTLIGASRKRYIDENLQELQRLRRETAKEIAKEN